jgi:hypothetical protein
MFDRIFASPATRSKASDTVMIDAGPLKAHPTAAILRKNGLSPAATDGPKKT